ncbi:MAG: hypothetical protein WKF75_14515 [Singulisphaera sp.]
MPGPPSTWASTAMTQVWSLEEILERLHPSLLALAALKRERRQFDPFRGRGHVAPQA